MTRGELEVDGSRRAGVLYDGEQRTRTTTFGESRRVDRRWAKEARASSGCAWGLNFLWAVGRGRGSTDPHESKASDGQQLAHR